MNAPLPTHRRRETRFLARLQVAVRSRVGLWCLPPAWGSPARLEGWMVLVLLGTLALAGAAELKWVLPAETSRLQAAPGRELADARCLVCHSADYISTQPRFNRGQWQATVLKMQQKYGAVVSTNESKTLVDYLVKSYGAETPANNSVPRR